MIRHRPLNEVVEDLRFALKVMEERSHSGLSHQAAEVLRNRILSQISAIEDQIAREYVPEKLTPALAFTE